MDWHGCGGKRGHGHRSLALIGNFRRLVDSLILVHVRLDEPVVQQDDGISFDDLAVSTLNEDKADVFHARSMPLPFVQALHKDFNTRWGDGSGILLFKEGSQS